MKALCSRDEFARFFPGIDPVAPGVEAVHQWRPELGAVARKP